MSYTALWQSITDTVIFYYWLNFKWTLRIWLNLDLRFVRPIQCDDSNHEEQELLSSSSQTSDDGEVLGLFPVWQYKKHPHLRQIHDVIPHARCFLLVPSELSEFHWQWRCFCCTQELQRLVWLWTLQFSAWCKASQRSRCRNLNRS